MPENLTNIYKIARISAGLSQEQAAERLYISDTTIKAYETGQRVPCSDVVVRMTEEYGTKWLPLRHLIETSQPLGVLPDVTVQELPTAVLQLVNRMAGFADRYRTLMRIAEDGVIDDSEEDVFRELTDELNDIVRSALQVIYSCNSEKKERPEAATSRRSGPQKRTNCNHYYSTNSLDCKPFFGGEKK